MLKSGVEKSLRVRAGRTCAVVVAGLVTAALLAAAVGQAQAREGDRTLKILFTHTGEKGEFTFKRHGRYDRAVLQKLNYIVRDWRRNEPTRMDPRVFDLLWEVYRQTGSSEYINVVSGYRSLATNNLLRKRSRGVAKRSQHTQGRAIDFFIPGVPVSKIRKIGLKMQNGGVGYYPSSRSPFVHLDTGSIRHWPRMTRKQLTALFPDGETVHVPSDGKPLPGYERALAKLGKERRQTTVANLDSNRQTSRAVGEDRQKATVGKWLKTVFAGGADEEEDKTLDGAGAPPAERPTAPPEPEIAVAAATPAPDAELPPAPLPRDVPVKTRMILVAAAERSRVAAADELAMVALISAPQTRPAPAAAAPARAPRSVTGIEIASLMENDSAIAAPDRSALAALYLAAARRAAALNPGDTEQAATAAPIVTAALPASRPDEKSPDQQAADHRTSVTTQPFVAAAAMPAPSEGLDGLAAADRRMPAAAPVRIAAASSVALPRTAPPASAAADAPGSAIAAANALGLMGTPQPQPIDAAQKIELAYAAAGTVEVAKAAGAGSAGSAAYAAVTVNARLTTAVPGTDGLRRLMSALTTRTSAFALFAQPRPDRVPGLYIAPETAAEAVLPTAFKPPRTDRFAIITEQPRLRFRPPRLAGLY